MVDEVATKQPQLNRTEPIAVLNQLHRYVVQNFDRISEELSKDDASSLKPFISVSATPSKLFRPSHSSIGTDHTETPSKALMLKDLLSVVSQLGPVAAASAKPNVEVSGNRAVEEYIARFQGSDIASLKAKEIFYEGGVSKARKSVFYFIGRRFIVGQIAPELLMATVLSMLQPFTKTPFDVVVDLSRFSEQNQFDGFWLEQFAAIFPDELWNQLGTVYLFNVNTAFKKFLKLISRHVSARLVKRVVAVNALNEFNEFISPVELRLPRSTGMSVTPAIFTLSRDGEQRSAHVLFSFARLVVSKSDASDAENQPRLFAYFLRKKEGDIQRRRVRDARYFRRGRH